MAKRKAPITPTASVTPAVVEDSGAEQPKLLIEVTGVSEEDARKVLMFLSSAKAEDSPVFPQPFPKKPDSVYGAFNYFTNGVSQIDCDIHAAALAEAEDDFTMDDSEFYGLLRSSGLQKLRQEFIDSALKYGGMYALHEVVFRAYMAGRICPSRFVTSTSDEREARRMARSRATDAGGEE